MSKFGWATDIHLDFLGDDNKRLIEFAEGLVRESPTGLFLTGDLSVTQKLVYHLSAIERVVQRPIYFVLGNHDFYGGQIEAVRKQMHALSNMSPFLRYMPTIPYVPLTPATAVVGHDGWYDAIYGEWKSSNINMQDWTAIHDFKLVNGSKATIVAEARKLAHEGTLHVQEGIKKAVRYHSNIIVLTHFPPFAEAHVHEGKQGDWNAAPWFTSKMCGDMLLDAAKAYPKVKFTVLCGHTHGRYDGQIAPNLECHVGGCEYNKPALQGLIDVP